MLLACFLVFFVCLLFSFLGDVNITLHLLIHLLASSPAASKISSRDYLCHLDENLKHLSAVGCVRPLEIPINSKTNSQIPSWTMHAWPTFCFKHPFDRYHHPHNYCPLPVMLITQAAPHPKRLALPL